jgi:protein SCO1
MTVRKTLLAGCAVAALVAVTAACSSGGSSSSGGTTEGTGLVLINTSPYKGDIITPVAKPTTLFTADTTGKPYNITAMTRGRVTLLYFGYTTCPEQCPLTMSNIAAALKILPASEAAKVTVLFVTVDPDHDTLARLRYWLGEFDPAFIGLRGTLDQIQQAAHQTGVPVGSAPERGPDGTYAYAHGTEVIAYSTNGTAYESFFPSTPPANIAHDLALQVAGHHP